MGIEKDDRPIFEGPRQVNTPNSDPRAKDISADELDQWESLGISKAEVEAREPEILKVVERAQDEARKASARLLAQPAVEDSDTQKDWSKNVYHASPSGTKNDVWGSGSGRKNEL